MEIITVANQKGGVAKTTTAVNLSVAFAEQGNRVLLIDLDPQGNVALSFGHRPDSIQKTIFTAFMEGCDIQETIWKTHYKVDVIPSNRNLSAFDLLAEQNKKERDPAFWLREVIKPIKNRYDYIIIDNPPALGWLTVNSLAASTGLLVPMQSEIYAEAGLSDLMNTYKNVKDNYNPKLEILGVLLTMQSPRKTNLGTFINDDIKEYCENNKIRLFNTTIKHSVRFGEAVIKGQPAITFAKNEATHGYIDLIGEITNDNKA